jgi:hypothetical protein
MLRKRQSFSFQYVLYAHDSLPLVDWSGKMREYAVGASA